MPIVDLITLSLDLLNVALAYINSYMAYLVFYFHFWDGVSEFHFWDKLVRNVWFFKSKSSHHNLK